MDEKVNKHIERLAGRSSSTGTGARTSDAQRVSSTEVAQLVSSSNGLSEVAKILSERWNVLPQYRKEAVYKNQIVKERDALIEKLARVTRERDELLKAHGDDARQREQWDLDLEADLQTLQRKIVQLLKSEGNETEIQLLSMERDGSTKFKGYMAIALKTLRKVQSERDNARKRASDTSRRLKEEQRQSEALRSGVQELRNVLDALQLQHAEMSQDSRSLKENHQLEVDALSMQLRKMKNAFKSSERAKHALESELQELRALREDKSGAAAKMSREMERLIDEFQTTTAELRRKSAETQRDLDEQRRRVAEAEAKMAETAAQLRAAVSQTRDENERYRAAMEDLERRMANVAVESEEERQRLARERDEMAQRLAQSEEQMREKEIAWKVEEAKLKQSKDVLSKRLQSISNQMAAMVSKMEAMEQRAVSMQAEAASIRREEGKDDGPRNMDVQTDESFLMDASAPNSRRNSLMSRSQTEGNLKSHRRSKSQHKAGPRWKF